MNLATALKSGAFPLVWMLSAAAPTMAATPGPLVGAWTLVAADVIHADGTRGHDYGEAPKGLLLIDAEGRYALQIYKSERSRFASGDKAKGTPEEYAAATLGASCHYGTVMVDTEAHTLTLNLQSSAWVNQEGTSQKRFYELKGDELSYRVPPRPNGDVPVSVWRRLR
jgi:hypothetical protein